MQAGAPPRMYNDEPEFNMISVHIYQHVGIDLEAVVDPKSLNLSGNQMPELREFLSDGKDIKDLIAAGVFTYRYDAVWRVPNPKFNPQMMRKDMPNGMMPPVDINGNRLFNKDQNPQNMPPPFMQQQGFDPKRMGIPETVGELTGSINQRPDFNQDNRQHFPNPNMNGVNPQNHMMQPNNFPPGMPPPANMNPQMMSQMMNQQNMFHPGMPPRPPLPDLPQNMSHQGPPPTDFPQQEMNNPTVPQSINPSDMYQQTMDMPETGRNTPNNSLPPMVPQMDQPSVSPAKTANEEMNQKLMSDIDAMSSNDSETKTISMQSPNKAEESRNEQAMANSTEHNINTGLDALVPISSVESDTVSQDAASKINTNIEDSSNNVAESSHEATQQIIPNPHESETVENSVPPTSDENSPSPENADEKESTDNQENKVPEKVDEAGQESKSQELVKSSLPEPSTENSVLVPSTVTALIYKHLAFNQMITVIPDTQQVVGDISENIRNLLATKSVNDLIAEHALIKVGKKKVPLPVENKNNDILPKADGVEKENNENENVENPEKKAREE